MNHDILTQIKDACDRAVAEGYVLTQEIFGLYPGLDGLWETFSDKCLCPISALILSTRADSGDVVADAAALLGVETDLLDSFALGFDDYCPHAYIWGRDDWEDLGHACALYYVDGVRL